MRHFSQSQLHNRSIPDSNLEKWVLYPRRVPSVRHGRSAQRNSDTVGAPSDWSVWVLSVSTAVLATVPDSKAARSPTLRFCALSTAKIAARLLSFIRAVPEMILQQPQRCSATQGVLRAANEKDDTQQQHHVLEEQATPPQNPGKPQSGAAELQEKVVDRRFLGGHDRHGDATVTLDRIATAPINRRVSLTAPQISSP